MNSSLQAPTDKLESVQMLRAIAALAVVFFHIPLFRNGDWGVDIFFVISGFIMAMVTAKSGSHFFIKRIIRVVPLYWLGTFGVFAVALLLPSLLDNTTADGVGLLKSLFFIPYQKGEYVQPLLYLGWTLNYEMFFYALFAISMAISHRYRLLICSALLLALVVAGHLVAFDALVAQFYTQQILAEFVLGMGCYAFYARTAPWRADGTTNAARTVLILIGLVALVYMPFAVDLTHWLGRGLAWGIPAAVVFLTLVHGLSGLNLPGWVVLIGDASYSLYLFHPYVLKVFNKVFHVFDEPGALAYLMTPVSIVLCCIVAIGIYRLVELPMTHWLRVMFLDRRKLPSQPPVLPMGAASHKSGVEG
ncbi:acyltransferase family protein [Pseudomonas sp. Y24-6]|jgi:peptidoglycan/LPS O-acetylase OafA/YrhL|uniref:acyltransferase family protein n=1 Tax=Pseudomonas sp. Y24-6 TaxID=2750013 RepID=UPI001CE12654|nr:acyltransferase [Pseudomonas sp. Y24-6]MCA4963565.1 acyltransferase [Pseudomonas sp. Y24-6]